MSEFQPDRRALWCQLALGMLAPTVMGIFVGFTQERAAPLIVFLLVFTPVAALGTWYTQARFKALRYLLEGDHLTACYGVLWKVKRTTPLDKITNVDVRQGPIGRAFGFGSIWIFTPSTGSLRPEVILESVPDPDRVKTLILESSQAAKRRLGSSQGTS